VVREVDDEAVEAVRDRRTGGTARLVVGPEHEVIDEELRTRSEEICERGGSLVGLEPVLLVDRDRGQLASLLRKLVAEPGVLLFADEELVACGEPFFTCSDLVISHGCLLHVVTTLGLRGEPAALVADQSWRVSMNTGIR
jgi:hypothetical protein